MKHSVRISEIFYSLQGEARSVGWPTVFIRLTGCPLRCTYCDTAYAFHGGKVTTLDDIMLQVKQHNVRHVCVTGGEPLAQPGCIPLLEMLCDQNYHVSLETSGALNVSAVDPRVVKVMDLKTPSSGEMSRNLWTNLDYLRPQDQIKFVIGDRTDFDWAVSIVAEHRLAEQVDVLFSPSHNVLSPTTLADWILEQQLPVRLQVQLHKILWGDVAGK